MFKHLRYVVLVMVVAGSSGCGLFEVKVDDKMVDALNKLSDAATKFDGLGMRDAIGRISTAYEKQAGLEATIRSLDAELNSVKSERLSSSFRVHGLYSSANVVTGPWNVVLARRKSDGTYEDVRTIFSGAKGQKGVELVFDEKILASEIGAGHFFVRRSEIPSPTGLGAPGANEVNFQLEIEIWLNGAWQGLSKESIQGQVDQGGVTTKLTTRPEPVEIFVAIPIAR